MLKSQGKKGLSLLVASSATMDFQTKLNFVSCVNLEKILMLAVFNPNKKNSSTKFQGERGRGRYCGNEFHFTKSLEIKHTQCICYSKPIFYMDRFFKTNSTDDFQKFEIPTQHVLWQNDKPFTIHFSKEKFS